jgi:hypothetical protein
MIIFYQLLGAVFPYIGGMHGPSWLMVTKKGGGGAPMKCMKSGTNSLGKKQNMLVYDLVTVSMKRMGRNEK